MTASKQIRFAGLKRWAAAYLCSAPVGRLLAIITRDRIPNQAGVIKTAMAGVSPTLKAMIFWGIYESAEIRFVRKYLAADRDVVEFGSSLGVVASHAARKLEPGRRMICVEANPGLPASIEHNVNRDINPHAPVQLTVVHSAICYAQNAKQPDTVQLHLSRHSTGSYVNNETSGGSSPIQVQAVRLNAVLRDHGIKEYALICDIEGAEAELIQCEQAALRGC